MEWHPDWNGPLGVFFFFSLLFFFFFPAERRSLLPSQIYRNDRGKKKGGQGMFLFDKFHFFFFSVLLSCRKGRMRKVLMKAGMDDRFLWPID